MQLPNNEIINYIKTKGVEIIDENNKKTLETHCKTFHINYMDIDNLEENKVETSIINRYYMPKWRKKLLKENHCNTRKLVFTDDKHCVSLISVIVRGSALYMEVFMRSCDAINKMKSDVLSFRKFLQEAKEFYGVTTAVCYLHIMSLHIFI